MSHRPIDPTPRQPDSYRGYPAEYPTPGQTLFVLAVIVGAAVLAIGGLFARALS